MADIPINPVTRRVEFTGNTGTGPFAFTFNVLAQADVAAYKNNTLLALTSDYTVSLNSNGTGSITLVSALIATDELVIIGDLALSRTTDFVTAGDLLASSLNEQFDSNVVMSQQLDERFDRTIRSQPGDINKNLYLPLVSSRASQLLSFDSSGNITTTSLSNVPDIGTVNLTVSGVASFADGSASAPSITNIGDTNTGMYFGAADQINFSIGGSEVISVASTGTTISGLSISSGDILLTDNSATALEIKEGSNNYLTFITTNGSEKLSFGSTANPTFEVNGSFRQPLIAATTSFFSQTYSGATLSATNGAVNIESYSASKAGIVLNGSGDQITFTSPTLGFVGLVQVVGAITTNTSLNIASSTTVDGILDEDDMSSNSETKLATQQSIKAYVDAQVGTVDTLAEVLGNGNTTGSNNIIVTAGQSITVDTISETTAANGVVIDGVTLKDGGATVTADVSFGVNDKAIFGAGSDLSIYHDGLHSYIEDSGTGRLHFKSNSYIFYNAAGTERAIDFLENDEVRLYFDGSEKLATTITGVDVTGALTSDALTVDGDGTFSATNPTVDIKATNGNDASLILMETTGNDFGANGANGFRSRYDGGDNALYIQSGAETTIRNRIKVDRDTGDISFYEDTGTTPKFFWDSSTERLGIGNSSPTTALDVTGTITSDGLTVDGDGVVGTFSSSNNNTVLRVKGNGATNGGAIGSTSTDDLVLLSGLTEKMRIQNNGDISFYEDTGTTAKFFWDASEENLGIGTTSPDRAIKIHKDNAYVWLADAAGGNVGFLGGSGANDGLVRLYEGTGHTAKVEIHSNADSYFNGGNVGIGTSSPSTILQVTGNSTSRNTIVSNFTLDGGTSVANPYDGFGFGINFIGRDYGNAVRNYASINTVMLDQSSSSGGGDAGFESGLSFYTNGGGASDTDPSERMRINSDGSCRWTPDGTNPDMTLDASGNLLVGTTTTYPAGAGVSGAFIESLGRIEASRASAPAIRANRNTTDGDIVEFRKDGTTVGSIGASQGSLYSGSGDVGLLYRSSFNAIYPSDSSGSFTKDNSIDLGGSTQRFKDLYLSGSIHGDVKFENNAGTTEYARFDSNNLLVGKTSADNTTQGIRLLGSAGFASFVRAGAEPIVVNRLTDDGDLIEIRKDGATVGSIGANSSAAYFVGTAHGLIMHTGDVRPCTNTGANDDNSLDLGASFARFADIYATNGTIQTSDRNEKQDIAELTDVEQRVAVAAKGLLRKFRWKDAVAEKGDEARTHFGIIAQDLQAAFAAEGLDAGDYAMFISSTWTDEETGEERTRMGVRYSELLAFIIAAI